MSSLNSFNIESVKEGTKNSNNKNEKDEEMQSSKESNNIELNILDNLDVQKIKELNSKCVDFIFQDKTNIALEILKKIELFLESNIIESKFNFDKKLIIIILHNIACSYQKLKDYNNCITYLDGVVHHFDKELEKKHQIKISEEYFYQNISKDQSNYSLLGDLILELRFSAKFHLQMCAALSQANKHIEALKHAKLACLICEDNLIKTYYLFFQMKLKNIFSNENKNSNNNNKSNDKEKDEEDEFKNSEKMKLVQKIVQDLFNRITSLRKHFNNEEDNNIKKNNNLYYNSYLNYRKNEIHEYQKNTTLLYVIRNSFGTEVKEDDWIQLLTIHNIIYLSPLNNEDLDLDSDPKYELLRDAILEKVVMLTVSFFCVAMEMKQLSPDKNNRKTNGEFFHHKAVSFSNLYLPVSCSIVKHFINSYYKCYGRDLDVVPEGKIIDYKIDLIKNEIEMNKDPQSFLRIQKMNYSNNVISTNNDVNIENISQDINKDYINNIGNKKDKFPFSLKLNLNLGNILNKNNNNETNTNITKNKKLSPSNDKKQLNNSNNLPKKQNKENIENNNNFTIIPNKNSLQFAEKSKIKEMPKFKLNFNKLNNLSNSVEENMSNDKITQNSNKNKIKKISTKISIYNKKFRHSTSNNKIIKNNVSKNKGYKTERSNSNNKPINIDETLKMNQRKKISKIYIKKISFNKSFYQSQYLSKTSRYQKKKSPTIDNKGKIKGNLTDRVVADKNKSIRKSNEKNKHKSYSKKNIEHMTHKELIKLDIREKINLNNCNNINSIKNNLTNNSNILKPIKSNNSFYNENCTNNLYNKIKHNNLTKNFGSTKKKIASNISNNKNLMKNNKKDLVDKMNKKLYIELKNNTICVNNNYGNVLEYSKCERNSDQINNFNSLIKINPFKS